MEFFLSPASPGDAQNEVAHSVGVGAGRPLREMNSNPLPGSDTLKQLDWQPQPSLFMHHSFCACPVPLPGLRLGAWWGARQTAAGSVLGVPSAPGGKAVVL